MLAVTCLVLLGSGCSGSDGEPGPPGPPGPPVGVDIGNATEITAEITSVTIASPAVVDFSLADGNGNPVKNLPASAISFKIAKLIPGTDGNTSAWQSYVNRLELPGVGPGTEAKVQATTENGAAGTLLDNDDGSYTYTFALDLAEVTDPIEVTYDPALTHRVGFEIRGYAPVHNPVYTFRPSDNSINSIFSREITSTDTCNTCHAELSIHGGARFEIQDCVICHNPGSADANSGNTVDMTVMTHKIHHGANLPSVSPDGEYCIYGFGDFSHCYEDVVYPQDIRACSNCHDAENPDTPEASNWYTMPTAEACGACHDDVNFVTGENHASDSGSGIPANNSQCITCHANQPDSPLEVRQAHRILDRELAATYEYNLLGVTTPGPGGAPTATFSVTNPEDGDSRYDLATDENLAMGALRLSIAWPTTDYSNDGNGQSNSQPETTNVYDSDGNLAAMHNGDLTYDLTLGTVPLAVTGSGVVVFEGRVSSGLGNLGVPNAHKFFAITDSPSDPTPRRMSVDMALCNDCHDSLSQHGARNTDAIEACQVCHNANAAGSRSGLPMDMKHFLHRKHAVDDIRYPQPTSNCVGCHTDDGYYPVASDSGVLPTSTNRGAESDDPFDNDRITANSAACGVCHSSNDARVHMEQNGGSFDACLQPDGSVFRKVDSCGGGTMGELIEESCTVCHGPGRTSDVKLVHGL
jgi:OmcA/MtrC family decaheme c-type cytochrome